MLDVEELSKTYDTGDEALKGVSADLTGNEIVAMIGPSGAGKSTFVRCINRLVEPTGGKVVLDGVEITGLSKKELRKERRNVGMIFQEYNLFERLTVMENVLSGRLGYTSKWKSFTRRFEQEDIERAYEVLDIVGMHGFENNRASELSGGQRQRVGIARAILQRPKLILADEPTSSLDPETSATVMELLRTIGKTEDIPILINIHEVPLAEEFSDRIVGLHDGELVFEGPPEELGEQAKGVIYRGEQSPDAPGRAADIAGPASDDRSFDGDVVRRVAENKQ
ncbi:phosphonate ABC transporter ATP-binding protein [Natrarchaeobius sp. A-rgal3]|uniref:phosphonate ABC transporter ATP-binding protein n=1 Tax=Natrarchaeobius versutus TaxID=1679078 RepID=UPI00350F533E